MEGEKRTCKMAWWWNKSSREWKCPEADQSLDAMQGSGIHVCHFQENVTLPIHTGHIFLPGICGDKLF